MITAAAVLVAERFGLTDAAPAALVGLVPIIGAACLWHWRREPLRAIAALAVTGLVYTGLAVGPAAARIAGANALPALVQEAHRHAVVLVREDDFAALSAGLPEGVGVIGRSRPLFRDHDFLLVGTHSTNGARSVGPTAAIESPGETTTR